MMILLDNAFAFDIFLIKHIDIKNIHIIFVIKHLL